MGKGGAAADAVHHRLPQRRPAPVPCQPQRGAVEVLRLGRLVVAEEEHGDVGLLAEQLGDAREEL